MCKGYKAIGIIVVIVVDTKVTEFRDLDTRASCKCNESFIFGGKLALVCLESMAWPTSVTICVLLFVIVATPVDRAH